MTILPICWTLGLDEQEYMRPSLVRGWSLTTETASNTLEVRMVPESHIHDSSYRGIVVAAIVGGCCEA